MPEKHPEIKVDMLLAEAYSHFVQAFNEANSFCQVSWQLSEAVNDLNSLPNLPVVMQFGMPDSAERHNFVKSHYRDFTCYYGLVFTCSALEQYFLTPYLLLNLTKQMVDGTISLQALEETRQKVVSQSMVANLWYRFKNESGIQLQDSNCIDSILTVRNCLVHRHGKVDGRDLRGGTEMIARWLHFDLLAGEHVIDTLPYHNKSENPVTVSIRSTPKEVRFKAGDQIKLSLGDTLNIHQTLWLVVSDAHNKTLQLINEKLKPKTS